MQEEQSGANPTGQKQYVIAINIMDCSLTINLSMIEKPKPRQESCRGLAFLWGKKEIQA